jgi:hypothetical protein
MTADRIRDLSTWLAGGFLSALLLVATTSLF